MEENILVGILTTEIEVIDSDTNTVSTMDTGSDTMQVDTMVELIMDIFLALPLSINETSWV